MFDGYLIGVQYGLTLYRVSQLFVDLGWVDLYFGCCTVCPNLPWLKVIWQKRPVQMGNMVEHLNQSQPNPSALYTIPSTCTRKCDKPVEDKKPAKKRRMGYVGIGGGGSSDEDNPEGGGGREAFQ